VLDIARPESRAYVQSHPQRLSWGIVDVLLAALMLPFGIGMYVIERVATAAAALFSH
jgi:hypothetical protein